MAQTNRLESFDISKGIAILLMVMGHSSIPPFVSCWIYSFHMPFFFIVSGMLTKWEEDSIGHFVLRKTKTLVFPFLIYSIINWLLIPFYRDISLTEAGMEILVNGWGGLALWFIPVLYGGSILVKCLPKRFEWFFMILLLTAGILLSKNHIRLPWTISTIPVAAFFIFIGRITAVNAIAAMQSMRKHLILAIAVLSLAGGGILSQVHTTDLAWNNITPFWITLIGAILGSIFLLTLSTSISNIKSFPSRVLSFLGRNTFVILAFSQVIIALTNKYSPTLDPVLKYSVLSIVIGIIIFFQSKVKNLYHAYIRNPHTSQG